MKKLVIIGGGFAGALIAKNLEKKMNTTLIDSKDYFEFTPSVVSTLMNPIHAKKIQEPHKNYLKNTKIFRGEVNEISEKSIKLKDKKINFDYLAICSGSTYHTPFKEKDIIVLTRTKHLTSYHNLLSNAKKIIIVGGGLVGVELASEISTKYKDKKVSIFHSKKRLIERNPERASKYAENFLSKRGVEIHYDERIIEKKGKFCTSNKNKKYEADIIFLCTGITPNSAFMKKNFSKMINLKGYIKTNSHLNIQGFPNIFVGGDVSDINEEKTAQNAKRQAKKIIKNLKKLERKKPLSKYIPKKTPIVISLGKLNGIFVWKNFVLPGIIPAIIKKLIEIREMAVIRTPF